MRAFNATRFSRFQKVVESVVPSTPMAEQAGSVAVVGATAEDITALSGNLDQLLFARRVPLVAIHTGTDIDGDDPENPLLEGGCDALLSLCDPSRDGGGGATHLSKITVVTSPAAAKARACYRAAGFGQVAPRGLLFHPDSFDLEDVLVFLCGTHRASSFTASAADPGSRIVAQAITTALRQGRKDEIHNPDGTSTFAPLQVALHALRAMSLESNTDSAACAAATELFFFATTFLDRETSEADGAAAASAAEDSGNNNDDKMTIDKVLRKLHSSRKSTSPPEAVLIDLSDALLPRKWVRNVIALLCRRFRRIFGAAGSHGRVSGGALFLSNTHNYMSNLRDSMVDAEQEDDALVRELSHVIVASRSPGQQAGNGLALNCVLHTAHPDGIPASCYDLLADYVGSRSRESVVVQQQQLPTVVAERRGRSPMTDREPISPNSAAASFPSSGGGGASRPPPLLYEGIAVSLYNIAFLKSAAASKSNSKNDDEDNSAGDPTTPVAVKDFVDVSKRCERHFALAPKHGLRKPIVESVPGDSGSLRLTEAGVKMAEACCSKSVLFYGSSNSHASVEVIKEEIAKHPVSDNIVFLQ